MVMNYGEISREATACPEDLQLQSIVKEYKTQPHTPELVTRFWQTFLGASIEAQRLDITVPTVSCDRTQKELEVLKKEDKMWVPETKLTYAQLGMIFPKMESYAVAENSLIKDEFEQDAKGVDVEMSIDSPNRNTTQKGLEDFFKSQGRNGMRLSTFVLSSQASKSLTGHYLDENTWSRLLGSRGKGSVVSALFYPDGKLNVNLIMPPRNRHPSYIGGRSEGVKKT